MWKPSRNERFVLVRGGLDPPRAPGPVPALIALNSAEIFALSSRLQVVDMICKLAKKGLTPSQIGVILRDNHGIPLVTTITGNKVLRILKVSHSHIRLLGPRKGPATGSAARYRCFWA